MKKTLIGAILIASMLLPVLADNSPSPSLADQARLRIAQSNLHNFATALEMWQHDHKAYPETLAQLVPNYLRHIPPGPHGSPDDWEYEARGSAFQLQSKGKPFDAVGLSDPAWDSRSGLANGPVQPMSELRYSLTLPSDQVSRWVEGGAGFRREGQYISCCLAGPFAFDQSGPGWVDYAVEEYRGRPGATIELEKPFAMGELSGREVVSVWLGWKRHCFYVTDGEACWTFEYTAQLDAFSAETDAMFVEMVKTRRRG